MIKHTSVSLCITMATKEKSSYTPCTPEDLDAILTEIGMSSQMPLPMDEVYDRVFVGEERIARNKEWLKEIGITHVLNCAQGPSSRFCVDTDQAFYDDVHIKFCGLQVTDLPESNLKQHFGTAVDFIDDALAQKDGRVLVHCVVGYSRSPTVAIAYLMTRRGMTAQEALRTVREKREIGPNEGFLQQLCQLNEELHSK